MNRRALLADAESTALLKGVRLRIHSPKWTRRAYLVFEVAAAIAVVLLVGDWMPAIVALLPSLVAWRMTASSVNRGLAVVTRASRLVMAGEEAACERELVALLAAPQFDVVAQGALFLLGTIAGHRGDHDDAIRLHRAVCSLDAVRARSVPHRFEDLSRAELAFELAAVGRIDDAKAEIASAADDTDTGLSRALVLRAEALALFRSGDRHGARELVRTNRAMLRNALTTEAWLLMEVIEALGAPADAAPTRTPAYPETREYVTRLVPDARAVLAET
jgi:hypothetical protein